MTFLYVYFGLKHPVFAFILYETFHSSFSGSGRVDVGESMKFLDQLISQMDPSKSAELRAQLKRITDDLANGNHQGSFIFELAY